MFGCWDNRGRWVGLGWGRVNLSIVWGEDGSEGWMG